MLYHVLSTSPPHPPPLAVTTSEFDFQASSWLVPVHHVVCPVQWAVHPYGDLHQWIQSVTDENQSDTSSECAQPFSSKKHIVCTALTLPKLHKSITYKHHISSHIRNLSSQRLWHLWCVFSGYKSSMRNRSSAFIFVSSWFHIPYSSGLSIIFSLAEINSGKSNIKEKKSCFGPYLQGTVVIMMWKSLQ